MSYKTIVVTEVEGVRRITLNRPERRNAMTPEMQVELIVAMEEAAASDCRAVVFAGAGEAFCAGLDLSALQGMNDRSAAEHTADAERVARLFRTLYELPKPTIAVVQGPAIAGGMGLATMCDFTLAAPEAKFGYTEVRIGFVPAIVSSILVWQVGHKIARDLLLSGRIFDAAEALRFGLVNEIVPAEHLITRARELAVQLMENSPTSVRQTKKLINGFIAKTLDQQIEAAVEQNAGIRQTEDFREGVTAFL